MILTKDFLEKLSLMMKMGSLNFQNLLEIRNIQFNWIVQKKENYWETCCTSLMKKENLKKRVTFDKTGQMVEMGKNQEKEIVKGI